MNRGILFLLESFINKVWIFGIVRAYYFLCFHLGFGFAFASLPALTMIGRYFKNKRSLANGLSRSGGGATFFLAPLLQYLVLEYGWRVS